ncbi:CopG family transcriptional regulator [Nostoc sp. 'Peltigera membranacea cyanobiont' 232]|nr:CopG family transcriptional regulator [Nostoc sp. 'Peltigera membranacea cyanobiont' 232]
MRDKRLVVRVTEYELLQLQQEADNRGVSSSDVVRAWIAKLPKPKKTISD